MIVAFNFSDSCHFRKGIVGIRFLPAVTISPFLFLMFLLGFLRYRTLFHYFRCLLQEKSIIVSSPITKAPELKVKNEKFCFYQSFEGSFDSF